MKNVLPNKKSQVRQACGTTVSYVATCVQSLKFKRVTSNWSSTYINHRGCSTDKRKGLQFRLEQLLLVEGGLPNKSNQQQ